MSVVGPNNDLSPLLAIQAQHVASKARDREKSQSASGRRFNDLVELRVSGVETADAVRGLPQNDSEQAESEHDSGQATQRQAGEEEGPPRPRIDVKA